MQNVIVRLRDDCSGHSVATKPCRVIEKIAREHWWLYALATAATFCHQRAKAIAATEWPAVALERLFEQLPAEIGLRGVWVVRIFVSLGHGISPLILLVFHTLGQGGVVRSPNLVWVRL